MAFKREWGREDFINLAQGRERWHGFVNTAVNMIHFLARLEHTEITGATLLHSIDHGAATAEFRTPSLQPLHRRLGRDSVIGTATLRA
jgi:hypothetical protein